MFVDFHHVYLIRALSHADYVNVKNVALLQILIILGTALQNENIGRKLFPYSKFTLNKDFRFTISTRLSMFLKYFACTAYLTAKTMNIFRSETFNSRTHTINICLLLHFSKRIFEVLFIHKYSGDCYHWSLPQYQSYIECYMLNFVIFTRRERKCICNFFYQFLLYLHWMDDNIFPVKSSWCLIEWFFSFVGRRFVCIWRVG